MSGMSGRRTVATVGAFAVAAGFAVTMGSPVAGADPATITWTDGGMTFVRAVTDATPTEGQVVTVTTTVTGAGNTINWLEDARPTCLNYKQSSATVNGLPATVSSISAGTVRVAGSWDAATTQTFVFQYTVAANCTRDAAQSSGIAYNGTTASGQYSTQGPALTVKKNATTTALDPVGSLKAGVKSTLTAKVLGGRAGDLVDFFKGADLVGSGALSAAGVATYAWTPSNADAGTFDVTAKYLSTPYALESVSPVQSITITAGDQSTATTLSVPATALLNTDVTLEAQVSPFPGGGTVTFKNGLADLGTVPVGTDGKASLVQQFNVTGAKNVTAVYSGATGFAGSTSPVQTITVGVPGATDVATTVTLDIPAQVQRGNFTFLRANVGPKPTGGTLQFFSGNEPLGNPVSVTGGLATLSYAFNASGIFDVRAVYSGAPGFLGSDTTGTITVTDDPVPGTGGTGSASMFGS